MFTYNWHLVLTAQTFGLWNKTQCVICLSIFLFLAIWGWDDGHLKLSFSMLIFCTRCADKNSLVFWVEIISTLVMVNITLVSTVSRELLYTINISVRWGLLFACEPRLFCYYLSLFAHLVVCNTIVLIEVDTPSGLYNTGLRPTLSRSVTMKGMFTFTYVECFVISSGNTSFTTITWLARIWLLQNLISQNCNNIQMWWSIIFIFS